MNVNEKGVLQKYWYLGNTHIFHDYILFCNKIQTGLFKNQYASKWFLTISQAHKCRALVSMVVVQQGTIVYSITYIQYCFTIKTSSCHVPLIVCHCVIQRKLVALTYKFSVLQEVRAYHEECSQEESRYHYLHCMMQMVEIQQKKVADEMKAYTSADPYARKKTFR